MIRRGTGAAALTLALLLPAACRSTAGSSTRDSLLQLATPDNVTVTVRELPDVGAVLVDGEGRTLYMFPPDAGGTVTCTGTCAGTWPPLVIAVGHTPTGAGAARSEKLGTLADPNSGERIVTYGGYPLYRYAGDVRAGTDNGQALFTNGGPWYVLNPEGRPITTDPSAP